MKYMAMANSISVVNPSVCFEIQNIVGISTGGGKCKTYQVQWAPSWISGVHLLGCEDLIEQFESEQKAKEKETNIKVELIEFDNAREETNVSSLSLNVYAENVHLPPEATKQEFAEDTSIISDVHLLGCGDLTEQFSFKETSKEKEKVNESAINIEIVEDDNVTPSPFNGLCDQGIQDINTADQLMKHQYLESYHNHYNNNVSINGNISEFGDTSILVREKGMIGINAEEPVKKCNNHLKLHGDSQTMENTSYNMYRSTNIPLQKNVKRSKFNHISTSRNTLAGTSSLPNATSHHQTLDDLFPQDDVAFDEEYTTAYVMQSNETPEHCDEVDNNSMFNMSPQRKASLSSTQVHGAKKTEINKKVPKTFNSVPHNLVKPSRNLKEHSKIPKNIFPCSICSRVFKKRSHLVSHESVHKEGKHFPCNICRRMFSDKIKLQNHIEMHQKGGQCNTCQKKFPTNVSLEMHIRVHTGERPFECHICHKRFRQKNHLRIHVTNVHKEICQI